MDGRIRNSFISSLIYGAEKGLQCSYFECIKELESTPEIDSGEFETLFNIYLDLLTKLESLRDGGLPF